MFWHADTARETTVQLYDAAESSTYTGAQFYRLSERISALLRAPTKQVVAVFCDNSVATVAAYCGALAAGHAVWLQDGKLAPPLRDSLLETYRPEWVILPAATTESPSGYRFVDSPHPRLLLARLGDIGQSEVHEDTAVLLSTSGTTGTAKLVRLSYGNLTANAAAIQQYLSLGSDEHAITSLPLSYSYGLSVVNSHLLAGARLTCINDTIAQTRFWDVFISQQCTSLAGVPVVYRMLQSLRFDRMSLPHLRTLTQAGGRLAPELISWFADVSARKGVRFFVMYGQTEATARISYVPPDRLKEKVGSVGVAIPGGELHVCMQGSKLPAMTTGDIHFRGPNVMMGYAECRSDLARGDELHGELDTGDIGYLDRDGFLYITGRAKRFIKIFGSRLNLDDAERLLESRLGRTVACFGQDDLLSARIEAGVAADEASAQQVLMSTYGLPPLSMDLKAVPAIPLTVSGKKDYEAMRR